MPKQSPAQKKSVSLRSRGPSRAALAYAVRAALEARHRHSGVGAAEAAVRAAERQDRS